ncbi:aminomethyltransferase, mitochondrial-like [Diaphorina citri]|uniref:Aminomethyltransferase, mitochondrial n=1 Tax=Diaphorina citri TaxID=121845 RepID=A0A3Q0IIV7_DIACI|nr:aminomethyltransferase, mitochondrial-like [Diaphorina citri]
MCPLSLLNCSSPSAEQRTPLYDLHLSHGGKMVPFAGFSMPVQYGAVSITASHLHTRSKVSVFDVSHMLQTVVTGKHREEWLESICVADVHELDPGKGTLSLFTNEQGGIQDDLIVTKTLEDSLFLVSNASRRKVDMDLMVAAQDRFKSLGKDIHLQFLSAEERGLIAVQGPLSSTILQRHTDLDLSSLYFMTSRPCTIAGIPCTLTRAGYTGEDGVEISVPGEQCTHIVEALLSDEDVKLAGLGARDSLSSIRLFDDRDRNQSNLAQDRFKSLGKDIHLQFLSPEERGLIAVQGPLSSTILQRHTDLDLSSLYFMTSRPCTIAGIPCTLTRAGYTGEDGVEISVPGEQCTHIVEALLSDEDVKLAGLGARDNIRIFILFFYGNDMDETTSPVEAGLVWTIEKCQSSHLCRAAPVLMIDIIPNLEEKCQSSHLRRAAPVLMIDIIPNLEGNTKGNMKGEIKEKSFEKSKTIVNVKAEQSINILNDEKGVNPISIIA